MMRALKLEAIEYMMSQTIEMGKHAATNDRKLQLVWSASMTI